MAQVKIIVLKGKWRGDETLAPAYIGSCYFDFSGAG